MKTILFHISSLQDGDIERVLIELLQGLDPHKYKIRLSIAHDLGDLEQLKDQIPSYVEIHHILDSKLSATKKKKIQKTISFTEKIYEELVLPFYKKRMHHTKLKELIADADLIVDFDMTLTPYTRLLSGKKKVAYCHFSLEHYWDGKKQKLDKLVNRLKKYDTVVMLCEEMKDKATKLYPALKGNVVRIYNALDNERIQALSNEGLGGYDHLLVDGYFCSVGQLNEGQKDFTMLIKGYAACVKKYDIKQHLAIVGDGPSRLMLEELAIDEGVGDMVTFAGHQVNPYKWMRNSELFLFCSKHEGLPTVLIEALSLSCPIIATATPTGIKEILMNGKCGTMVEPGDVTGLCDAIYKVLNDKALQQNHCKNAENILHQFEIKKMVTAFENLVVA
ncbi:MAG: hypothetical protein JWQ38_1830 [Flavipsychrobacter sp.]|nr:hypothetical protein [Flavipsychrobacter sp.]